MSANTTALGADLLAEASSEAICALLTACKGLAFRDAGLSTVWEGEGIGTGARSSPPAAEVPVAMLPVSPNLVTKDINEGSVRLRAPSSIAPEQLCALV